MKKKKKPTTISELAMLGGMAVKKKYGKAHYKRMAAKRWANRKSKKH